MTNHYVSSVAYAAISTWAALTGGVATAISLGQYVRNTSPAAAAANPADTFKRVWKCTTAGTTNTTEPATWSTSSVGGDGTTTTDGTVVWTEVMGREAEQAAGAWHAPASDIRALCSARSVAAGDTIFVSSDHAETALCSASFGTYLPFPTSVRNCRVISVSRTGANLPPVAADITAGATIGYTLSNSSTMDISWAYYNGLTIQGQDTTADDTMIFAGSTVAGTQRTILENCLLEFRSTSTSQSVKIGAGQLNTVNVELINTPIKAASVLTNTINLGTYAQLIWRDTPANALQGTAPTAVLGLNAAGNNSNSGFATLRGLDLSLASNRVFGAASFNGVTRVSIEYCKLSASITDANIIQNTQGASDDAMCVSVDNCDDSTNGRNWRMFRAYSMGQVKAVINPVRDAGASDGVTGIAWAFSSVSDTRFGVLPDVWLQGPPIVQRYNTTGASKTLTLEAIYNGTALLTNAQLYIDAEVLGTAGVPLSGVISSKPATPLTAAANLTASTKTWDATARVNSHAYAVGDCISTSTNVGPVFFCTTAGTSAASVPGGYATAVDGGSVTDGTAVFRAGWRMSISVTFTPEVKGLVRVTPRFAKSNDAFNLLVDPFLTIV